MIERVLAIETSSSRGSVALVEGTHATGVRVLAWRSHDVENQHAERLLGMVEASLAEAGWKKNELTSIAAGVGPGSFTGVRVGLSLAQGLMLGLGIRGVGVGSLATVAAGLGRDDSRLRVVVRDARRGEFFVAAYTAEGHETVAPHTVAQVGASDWIGRRFEGQDYVVLGTEFVDLPCCLNELTTEPDARALGALVIEGPDHVQRPVTPDYVRGPDVIKPVLPPSPLDKPRRF
jgi:tRNA threonylcarbamoyl adenosine modification protein YeaZ